MAANQRVKNVPNVPEDDGIDGDFLAEGQAEEAAALARKAQEGEGANDAVRISAQALTNVNAKMARNKALATQQGKLYLAPTDDERQKQIEKEMDRLAAKEENAKKKRAFRKAEEDAGKGSSDYAGNEWARDWYLITPGDRVVKPGMNTTYSSTALNTFYAQYVPSGAKCNAYAFINQTNGFKEAHGMAYAAGFPPVYEYKGHTLVNTYRADSAPAAASEYTHEGWAAVETVRAHLRNLFGREKDERDAKMVESWIALNVRNPGKLIGVALLVKGAEGDGKTIIFHNMMNMLMGSVNVGEVSQLELNENFNAWAIGAALRVIEELKIAGKNRYNVTNSVKTMITNPEVRTVGKNGHGISSPNSTNYVGLTNHADALPINNADRRWWILFTPYLHRSELAAKVGDLHKYFSRVRSAVFDHADALRKYFLECEIHPEVFHGMQAPETDGRRAMLATDSNSIGGDYFDMYVADSLEDPPKWRTGVSAHVVAAGELTQWLEHDMGREDMPQSRQLNRLLTSRGYAQCEKPINWNGKTFRVYVKDKSLVEGTIENRTKVKELLDQTAASLGQIGTSQVARESF